MESLLDSKYTINLINTLVCGIYVKKLHVCMFTDNVFSNVTFVHKNTAHRTLCPDNRSHTASSLEGMDSRVSWLCTRL